RIDLKEKGILAVDQEIGTAQPFEIKALGDPLHASRQTRFQTFGKLSRLCRAPIAPFRVCGRCGPLLAEAEHAGGIAAADEEGRHRLALDLLLEIEKAHDLASHRCLAPHDVTASGAALAFGEPAGSCR